MSEFKIANILVNVDLTIPEDIIVEAIKSISETELNYMSEVYGYIEKFFSNNEKARSFFSEEEHKRFDSYVDDFGEKAVVACLVKNILEKL